MNIRNFFKTTVLLLSICTTVHLQAATGNGFATENTVPCDKGWILFGQKCYKAVMERLTWIQASTRCTNVGGHLVSIHSKEEEDFITWFITSEIKSNTWIGLHDTAKQGTFAWTDGSNVNYTIWAPGQPDNKENSAGEKEDCAEIFYKTYLAGTGKWNDAVCSNRNVLICQKKTNVGLSSPNPLLCSVEKGGGWKNQGACYNLVKEKKSWDDAEEYCKEKYNGHLVTISDWATDWFLNYILNDFRGLVWIGIKLRSEFQQKWVSGWYVSYNFLLNDATTAFSEEICILRFRAKRWVEIPCSQEYTFVCESSKEKPIILKNRLKGGKCPEMSKDWRDLGGEFCYYFDTERELTWFEATKECYRRGGTLASIHSQEETNILQPFIESTPRLFIGLNAILSGGSTFTWSDGTQLDYTYWYSGEPCCPDENCGEVFSHDMRWNDVKCDARKGYVCSARKVLPDGISSENPDGVSTANAFMSQSSCFCFKL